ncbi:copper resistance protein CopC [Allorhizocola rhizosphaerae]|uniref:copper resistance protein CopC n=1 Tax=Allorhizocola rhizosphaerae TaxID=1872709 RepID=UPI0013C3750E|nr:copper resistance protein CopC [Allorhizocola rhizosphaerae]
MRGSTGAVTVQPADGSTLVEPPAQVRVSIPDGRFREAHVSVASDAGVPVTSGPTLTQENTVTVPVSITSPGTYLVAYHLVRTDGHVLAGVTRFGVGIAPSGHSMGHAHPGDPINLALTGVALASVIAMLYVLSLRPSARPRRRIRWRR